MTKKDFFCNLQKEINKLDKELKENINYYYKNKFKECKKDKESLNELILSINIKKDIKNFKKEYRLNKNQENTHKFKDKLISFKNKLKKKKKFALFKLKKNNIKKFKKKISNKIEIIEEKIEEQKEINNRNISTFSLILLNILLVFNLVIFLWVLTIFISSLYAFLDGIRFFGIELLLFSLCCILLLPLIVLNNYLNKESLKKKKIIKLLLISLILFSVGLGLSLYDFYRCENINDVKSKYQMYKQTETFNLPTNIEKKYYIYFNGWYKTNYNIVLDNELENQIKVEVRYYEAYYDFNIKKDPSAAYIGLIKDNRDLISIYLENLREKKIYNSKELSRYVVKIYVNEKDKERLVISY